MFKKNWMLIIDIFILLIILALPYYLFKGKLFIGGDDTRLLYVYPWEFFTNISFFSWYNFSSVGSFNPNQFSLPFTVIWSILGSIIASRTVVDYLSFSLPLLLGYIYFQKLASELLGKVGGKLEIAVGAILFIFSPILILNQLSVFLYAAWLIGLLPIISYYYLRFLRLGQKADVLKACLYCIWLSLALFSIPWLLGFVLPVVVGLIASVGFYTRTEIACFIKKSLVFFIFLGFTQFYWLLPFSLTFLGGGNESFGGKVLSQQVADTFRSTVLFTASGNVLFPLLNLFHRQIAFDYNWELKSIYETFYDNIIFIDIIYLLLLFGGVFFVKAVFTKTEVKKFFLIFVSFVFSLFLFTVNIGPLKQVFLWFGILPGMAMFRNFYDKFALGYTLLFALTLTFSLSILTKRFPQRRYLFLSIVGLVAFINFIPIKDTIVRPLWKTTDIYSNITIPPEYIHFMNQIKNIVPSSANMFSLPYDIASYTFIKDVDSNNIFAGTSPVKIFSGINDFSGDLSFPSYESNNVAKYIKEKDYKSLEKIFREYNISYLFVTKNVPQEVKDSYLFNKSILHTQDKDFIQHLTDKKLLTSSNENYELYSLKQKQSTLQPQNISYMKINPTTYLVHVSHLKNNQKLIFLDSYHTQWRLYPLLYQDKKWCFQKYPIFTNQQECKGNSQLINGKELTTIFHKSLFENTHIIYNQRNNQWTLAIPTIQNLGNNYYKTNADGTIDTEFLLYFSSQSYFYVGSVISGGTVIILSILTLFQSRKRRHEKPI